MDVTHLYSGGGYSRCGMPSTEMRPLIWTEFPGSVTCPLCLSVMVFDIASAVTPGGDS